MTQAPIPQTTIQRLPVYLRCLLQAQSMHMPVINSIGIAEMAGSNAAQVRKDLSYLGEFGIRGIGYDVEDLIGHVSRWLGVSVSRHAAIIGMGRLGGALRSYGGFEDRGFRIVALFDTDPEKVRSDVGGLPIDPIEDLEEVIAQRGVEVVILTTPPEAAQALLDRLVSSGVKAILNFAPVRLDVPADVMVRQVDLAVELQVLSFHLANRDEER